MNNDLISRSAALNAILTSCNQEITKYKTMRHALGNVGRAAFDSVKALPAVDAEPVRHGKWSESRMPDKHRILYLTVAICPECKTDMVVGQYDNYCPNCGAKMDGETNGK